MHKTFIRRVEQFTCEHCGHVVQGLGYTNHCPRCLMSKHVDVHPGDRAAQCGGLMGVVAFETKHQELRMLHRCTRCGHEKWNRVEPSDDPEEIARQMKSC